MSKDLDEAKQLLDAQKKKVKEMAEKDRLEAIEEKKKAEEKEIEAKRIRDEASAP